MDCKSWGLSKVDPVQVEGKVRCDLRIVLFHNMCGISQ